MTYNYVAISSALRAEGFREEFVRVVMKLADEYDELQDLLTMWQEEEDPFDRTKTMDDIQEAIRDCLVPAMNTPERFCEKCAATGAVLDRHMATWRCTQCPNKWASSVWNKMPKETKRSFPEWHKHLLRLEGFPAGYMHQVIYVA